MLDFIKNPAERTRFIKFCFVGIFGAIVDFGVMNLLLHFTPATSTISSSVSFVAAVISNFIWNRYWTYPDSREKPLGRQLLQFFLVSIIGLVIRFVLFQTIDKPIISLCSDILGSDYSMDPAIIGHNITLVIAILIVMIWNFFANRFWTYNDVK